MEGAKNINNLRRGIFLIFLVHSIRESGSSSPLSQLDPEPLNMLEASSAIDSRMIFPFEKDNFHPLELFFEKDQKDSVQRFVAVIVSRLPLCASTMFTPK